MSTGLCQWCHTPLYHLSNTGRPRRYCDTRCRSPRTATANSPTATTNHGNDAHSPKAGDHQPPNPNPPPNHDLTKYY